MSTLIRSLSSCAALFALLALGAAACPDAPARDAAAASEDGASAVAQLAVVDWNGAFSDGWKQYQQLVDEDKYEAAAALVEQMLGQAKQRQDSEEQVRCLIRWTQLRMALHGYETAVKFLMEQPWPSDLLSQTVLNLYYGFALVNYAQSYSWEVNRRERVESKEKVDLKAWTMEQIYAEAQRAYEQVWQHRDQLDLPIGKLSDYIEKNSYPGDIRPTLRDAVSYLRVELLSQTQGWRPEHQNEIYRLDLASLLRPAAAPAARPSAKPAVNSAPAISLLDPEVHPIVKIVAILDDLERWHLDRKQRAAALEARLARLRVLQQHFSRAVERAAIRRDLEQHLAGLRDHAWWAMGMAQLAELVQSEETADSLVRARQIALDGAKAFPDSAGGQRCHHVVKSIEQPELNLAAMSHDGVAKRSIEVRYKNLTAVHLRAYALDLQKLIESQDDYELFPDYDQTTRLLKTRPVHEWSVELPATTDYKQHRQFAVPPIKKPGFYVVIGSAKKDFGRADNQMPAVDIIVGDLVLVAHQRHDEVEATVLSGETGNPVAGVEVSLYKYDWNVRHKAVDRKTTPATGQVRFSRDRGSSYFLLARRGDQIAVDPDYIYFQRPGRVSERTATLLFTDRSIYRPGQKILWKALVYRGRYDEANYRLAPRTAVTIALKDANHQTVESKSVASNDFGTASGEFTIPAGRLLGQWRLESSLGGTVGVRVEEYKRPTFETKLLDPAAPLRLNIPAQLKAEARYYFGLPLTSGSVRWRVQRVPVYPWWYSYWGWHSGGTAPQVVATGQGALGGDGQFGFSFTPAADERSGDSARDVSYSYTVQVDITDEGGETRSASRSFRVGFVAVEARVESDTAFMLDNVAGVMTITRTDLDGTPAPGAGAYTLVELTQPATTVLPADQPLPPPPAATGAASLRTEGDNLRPRWETDYQPEAVVREWKDGRPLASGALAHDAKGVAEVKLPALAAGSYRLQYETTDAFGAKYRTSKEFLVAGKQQSVMLPALLLVERSSVEVGGTARIVALSGLRDQTLFLDLYREGKRTRRVPLVAGQSPTLIELPVTEAERGGFGITLWGERDHQFFQLSESVMVPWDNKQLSVEYATFRDLLRPGQKEKWTVKVKGPGGRDVTARAVEILAYMYDRSLDAFVPHHPASPLSLYPTRTGVTWGRSCLGQAHTAWVEADGFSPPPGYPSPVDDQLKFYSGYGIGGPGGYGGGRGSRGMVMAEGAPVAREGVRRRMAREDSLEESKSEAKKAKPMAMPASPAASVTRDEAPAEKSAEEADGTRGPAEAPAVELRSDFSETAFWQPHLLVGGDGGVSFEFSVPDSVTSWNVWAHAVTRDLMAGSVKKESRTVKDLMVRPYLPRFLREGDQAAIKVVVNNASEGELRGKLDFDIVDPETGQSLLGQFGLKPAQAKAQPFAAPKGSSANLTFALVTPARVGPIAFKVTATSGNLSDGELRPIPVLPGRMHLMQSRFATLKDASRRELKFADLARDDDPSLINEQLVVTLDAQLFYSVLSALPYLVNYPYECTEQTLNRFVSTGILASLYGRYPAIERMAKEFSKRDTMLEQWDQPDPNRKMALEETPWVIEAKGGGVDNKDLLNVLDPRITRAQRDSSLAKLRKAQTSSGGFPWFPGGPPSPYMTLYLLYGFSKAIEFGVEVPRDLVQRGWNYLHRHYVDELVRECMARDACWETITFLNYVLSNYPDTSWSGGVFSDAERKQMLDFSFRHWKQHAPYLKGYLALTLKRMGREADARLVWASVLDSAKTAEDQGTFWAPEDRGWLWYNDSIETHAFAIRTTMELLPQEPKLDGMVLWIFLNKKLNHWKSTRATAEVIYSLAHYLKQTEQLGVREEAKVTIGDQQTQFAFEPDQYTGQKNQIVVPGEKVDAKKSSTIVVEKATKGYLFASATWHFSTEKMPTEDRGDFLAISRSYFRRDTQGREATLKPLKEGAAVRVGDEVEVQVSLKTKHQMEYVHLRDPRPAGFEPSSNVSRHKWDLGIYWYEEVRDSGQNFFFEWLPQGEYTFKYRIRAATAGTFKAAPATAQPMYAPEFAAYSAGSVIAVQPAAAPAK
ncbi:MAG: hypothetical protein JXR83_11875 [Deltaproteobacteria bacterium]|nr:hypothetical protein [Deltaproteobacteria bacterium]